MEQQPTSSSRTIVLMVGFLLLAGLIGVMGFSLWQGQIESVDLHGNTAPTFTLPLFDRFEEDQIRLADLEGQVVVLNFWASWCVECYKEARLLEEAWQDYRDQGVIFLGVDYLDTDKEGLAYMDQYGITYPSGPDIGSEIAEAYAITGVPETFFIDRAGNIAHVQIGPIEKPQLYALLDKLAAEEPPPKESAWIQ